jgi:hypothetical protein
MGGGPPGAAPNHRFHETVEIMLERKMNMAVAARESDKLSNLAVRLKTLEQGQMNKGGAELDRARTAVVMIVSAYRETRFNLGRVLHEYKAYFKAERGWTAAAQAVAEAINRDERTVYRIIADYGRASHAPTIVLQAMEAQKIDAAAPKNATLLRNLLEMPAPATTKEAEEVVARVCNEIAIEKREKRAAKKSAEKDIEEFAGAIVRQFESQFGKMQPKQRDAELLYVLERIVNTLRADIKTLRQFSRPALVPKPESREVA